MKGPRSRTKHEVRRLWECPVCKRHEWTGGHVVTRLCGRCARDNPTVQAWMTLREPERRRTAHEPDAAAIPSS